MKKILAFLAAALIMTGCDDKLDIVPLGKSTLSTVNDLETLLNANYVIGTRTKMEALVNNCYPEAWKTPAQMMANKNTITYAILTYDENVDREALTDNDLVYDRLYKYINYMNVIISKADEATGDDKQRKEIVAEAHVVRAWMHFLAANIFAAQYDEATIDQLGGIPYVDNTNAQELKEKQPLKYVYERILEDCSDDIIAAMPQKAIDNPCRGGAELGNAVRALVLFQMKRYAEALPYAEKALSFNGIVEDRGEAFAKGSWTLDYMASNNYLLIRGDNSNLGDYYGLIVTPEVVETINPNDYIKLLDPSNGWDSNTYGYGPEGSNLCGASDVHYNVAGIRTENVIYAAAECLIRTGKINDGLKMLDKVLEKRIFSHSSLASRGDITTEAQAMAQLQKAKRIEMLTTIYNFFDRRRWNTESAYAVTITRDLGENGVYSISPTSPLWIFPFPQDCRLYNSTLTSNY